MVAIETYDNNLSANPWELTYAKGTIFAELDPNQSDGTPFPGAGSFTWALIEKMAIHGS